MSPYPSQTDRDSIVETAARLIERDGVDGLSLAAVASEVGIKAPSLYRYIESKNELLHAVIENTYRDLFGAYDEALASVGNEPAGQLQALARAQRRFAHENPNTYMLAYTTANPELRADPDMLLGKAVEIQEIMARISGEPDSLPALRGALALTHGFISLELNGQLRRGGDLAETFDAVFRAYLNGWTKIH
jgi:AcrR family transcriptional regulator